MPVHRREVIAMKKSIRRISLSVPFGMMLFSLTARAGPEQGWNYTPVPAGVPTNVGAALLNITNYILGFVSIIAVLVILYGGLLYLTSAGNDDQVAKARRTIASGIVGLIIVGLAFAIVAATTDLISEG